MRHSLSPASQAPKNTRIELGAFDVNLPLCHTQAISAACSNNTSCNRRWGLSPSDSVWNIMPMASQPFCPSVFAVLNPRARGIIYASQVPSTSNSSQDQQTFFRLLQSHVPHKSVAHNMEMPRSSGDALSTSRAIGPRCNTPEARIMLIPCQKACTSFAQHSNPKSA